MGFDNDEASSNFTDVPADHPYYKDISILWCEHIINGYPDGSFQPEGPVTRAEYAILLTRLIDPELNTLNLQCLDFNDFQDALWAVNEISTVVYCGLMDLDDQGNFRPNDFLTVSSLDSNLNTEITAIRDSIITVQGLVRMDQGGSCPVRIYKENSYIWSKTSTEGPGFFTFKLLEPGTYTVQVERPPYYLSCPPQHFSASAGESVDLAGFDLHFGDFNGDDVIDLYDLMFLARNYGLKGYAQEQDDFALITDTYNKEGNQWADVNVAGEVHSFKLKDEFSPVKVSSLYKYSLDNGQLILEDVIFDPAAFAENAVLSTVPGNAGSIPLGVYARVTGVDKGADTVEINNWQYYADKDTLIFDYSDWYRFGDGPEIFDDVSHIDEGDYIIFIDDGNFQNIAKMFIIVNNIDR